MSNDTETNIYFNSTQEYPGWILYIILLCPTLVFNVCTISMILSSSSLRFKLNPILVVYLAVEDGLLTLFCLLSCASDYAVRGIYLSDVGCELQAIYLVFFMLSTGYTLCCIAYHNDRRVRNLPGLTRMQVFLVHLAIWVWSALITAFSTDGPDTSSRLMPSGVYCLVSLRNLLSGLLFFVPGIVTIGAFIIHRYIGMFTYIKEFWKTRDLNVSVHSTPELDNVSQRSKESHLQVSQQQYLHTPDTPSRNTSSNSDDSKPTSISEASLHNRLRAARKMFIFVVCYFMCASPVLILSLYEISGTDAPGSMHIVAGFFIHLNSLLNPLLYFWTNPSALKQVPLLKKYYFDRQS